MNELRKKVSVITPVYNNSHLLEDAINSLLKQNINEEYSIEYLIIDDGSEFFDEKRVRKLLNGCCFPVKILINNDNIGTVATLNRALSETCGEFIILLPADDSFYDNDVVNDVVNEFNCTNALIMTSLRVPYHEGKEFPCRPSKNEWHLFDNQDVLLKHLMVNGNVVSGASTYYRRDIFCKIGWFDERFRLLEDYPFVLKALRSKINIHFFNRKTILYGCTGVSSSHNPLLYQDKQNLLQDILQFDELSFFNRRYVFYRHYLKRAEKLKVNNILLYPEQFTLLLLNNFVNYINNKIL